MITDTYLVERTDGTVGQVHEYTDANGNVTTVGEPGTRLDAADTAAYEQLLADERTAAAAAQSSCNQRCTISTQPTGQTVDPGDPVDFGVMVSSGSTWTWQRADNAAGPFVDSDVPLFGAVGDNGSWWRLCCDDDASVCTDAVELVVNVASCQITVSPSNVTGAVGDPIAWDGAAVGGSIDWYYSETGANGPWIAVGGPAPTVLTNEMNGRHYMFCCRDSGGPTDNGSICSTPALISVDQPGLEGHVPANFDCDPCVRTDFPDPRPPAGTGVSPYRSRTATVPEVIFTAGHFRNADRPSSITSSNNVAGEAYTDPLVYPGVVGGPVASMTMGQPHQHTFLGNVYDENANLLNLANEPLVFQPGTDAANDGWGYRGLITDGNGQRFGYSPGFWWPTIYFDGQPVSIKRGIAIYYVRVPQAHSGERILLLPNGVGWVDGSNILLNEGPNGVDWRIRVFGPSWAHRDIHVGPFPVQDPSYNSQYLSWANEKPGPDWCAIAQFQSYIKMDIPAGAPSYAQIMAEGGHLSPRFHYGNPTDIGLGFHVDYVSGWTNQEFAQELLDRATNRDLNNNSLNNKYEGLRFEWNTSTALTPAPTEQSCP